MVYFYPELELRDAAASRKEGVEKELPFFAVLANVLGGAGLSLYAVLESGVGKGTFRHIEAEALLVKRDVTIFGSNPVDALEALAASHPSRKFADFIFGYTSKVRSGGDVPAYLVGESGILLGELEGAWGKYAARVGTVGSLMVTIFGVVPLLLLVVGFFSQGAAVFSLGAFSLIIVPFMTFALVVLAGRLQPMQDEPLRGKWVLAAAASAPGILVGLLLGAPWISAAASLFTFSLLYGLSVRAQRREAGDEETSLRRLLEDLMEFKRMDYDLDRSLVALSARSKYGKVLDALLNRTAAQLQSGVPLNEVEVQARTKIGRVVFFVLGEMAYSGGGTVDTVFQLSHYAGKMIEMKRASRSEVKPYLLLSYITPLLLVFGVAFVGGVLSSLRGGLVETGATGWTGLQFATPHPALFQMANLLIVMSAAGLGMVGAKISDLTVRNTLRASTNLAIAVVATLSVPLLNLSAFLH